MDLKCLVVDDNEGIRSTLARILQHINIGEVKEAGTAEEALEVMRDYQAGLVLMDTEMSLGMLGYEACKMLKDQYKNTVVIGMSGKPKEFRSKWYEAGADDFLEKPLETGTITILESRIKRALENRL